MIVNLTISYNDRSTQKNGVVKEYRNFTGPIPRVDERIRNATLPIGCTMLVDKVIYEFSSDYVEVGVHCI